MALLETISSESGLRVVLAPREGAPLVALQAWIGAGSADDPPNLPGVAHAVEHMVFKGTPRRGVGEIAAAIEGAGGEINAWTSFDHTVFHLTVEPAELELGLEVLADAIADPLFDADELERERRVIGDELRLGAADPGRVMAQTLFATAFRTHPYRRPVLGTARSIARIRRPDLVRFADRHYRAGNLILVVAGAFDPEAASAAARTHFSRLEGGGEPRRRGSEPPIDGPRLRLLERDTGDAHLAVAFPAPPMAHPDHGALDLLAIALGQGESSRLHRRLTGDLELPSISEAQIYNLRDPGLVALSAVVPVERAADAFAAMCEEALALGSRPLSADELDKAVHAVEADAVYGRETTEGLARSTGLAAAVAGDPRWDEVQRRRARAQTPERLRRLAARTFSPERAVAVAIGPPELAGRLGGRAGMLRRLEGAHAAARSAPPARPRRHSRTAARTLASGIRVVVHPDHSVPLVAARAVWPGGLRLESGESAGIDALLAATLTRGCGDLDAAAVSHKLDRMAATMSGFSGRNSFGAQAEWLAADWRAGLDLLVDCLVAPRLETADIERERRALLEDSGMRAHSPSHLAFRLFVENLYQKHPYRLDPLGSPESLQKLTPEAVRRFFRRNYPPGGLTLAIVGDVDPDQVMARLERRLASVSPARRRDVAVERERFAGRPAASREVYGYVDRAQAHVVVGFPGATLDDPDRLALEVLAAVLGGQGGRLFVELRERRGLAYRVGAHSQEGADPGYFAVVVTCSPERAGQVIATVRQVLESLRQRELPRSELARAVRYLAGSHRASLERRGALAAALAFYEAHGLGWKAALEVPAELSRLTPADLRRAARRFLDWNLAVTATVTPPLVSPGAARRARGRSPRAGRGRR